MRNNFQQDFQNASLNTMHSITKGIKVFSASVQLVRIDSLTNMTVVSPIKLTRHKSIDVYSCLNCACANEKWHKQYEPASISRYMSFGQGSYAATCRWFPEQEHLLGSAVRLSPGQETKRPWQSGYNWLSYLTSFGDHLSASTSLWWQELQALPF